MQQAETEKKGKKSEWDVIICGGGDESDEEESLSVSEFDRIVNRRGAGIPGCHVLSEGEASKPETILTPSWRKVGRTDSELSGESTYASDGKMGRWVPAACRPRGQYAMGAPRTNMSHCVKIWVSDGGTESSDWEHGGMVSDAVLHCCIYHWWVMIRGLVWQVQAPYSLCFLFSLMYVLSRGCRGRQQARRRNQD